MPGIARADFFKITCVRFALSQTWNVFGRGKMALALLLVIPAGCSTAPRDDSEDAATPAPAPDAMIASPAPIIPNEPITVPIPAPVPVNLPALVSAPVAVDESWISLDRWSQANGFGTPKRLAGEPAQTYFFNSTNGTMSVRMGSQLAYWNGMECLLGFPPQLIDGHPFVHSLDARKNFAPLLDNAAHAPGRRVIVIDPGHGGTDIGTTDILKGHYEKEYTLDWARRLQAALAGHGWTVLLTRSNDVTVSLTNRVAFAEQQQADLFLSLHFNSSFPDRQQAGLETYCLTPAGMPSNLTRGYRDDPALIYPNNSFDAENLQYAVELHRALLKINGHADRGVRRARFLTVLQGQNRPAVLVEGGYLSNPGEARQIADPAYRQKLAEALAQALLEDLGSARFVSQSSASPPATNVVGRLN
jgi:N-acetylmuramoyl-L-alanine amidase